MPQRPSRRRAALSTLFGTGATVAITIAQAFILIPLCLTYLGGRAVRRLAGRIRAPRLAAAARPRDSQSHDAADRRLRRPERRRGGVALVRHGIVRAGCDRRRPRRRCHRVRPPGHRLGDGYPRPRPAHSLRRSDSAPSRARCCSATTACSGPRGVSAYRPGQRGAGGGALSGLLVSVGLLVAGFGVWSLAYGLLARAVVSAAGAVLS